MAYFKVLNVGQGDSIVIRPPQTCMCPFAMRDIFYVDVGPGNTDVTKEINEGDRVHIILTHHHYDHINGFKYFFNNFQQVTDITVPYCLNEIVLIAKAILNLKGIKSATSCQEFIKLLKELTDEHLFLKTALIKNDRITINFADDNFARYEHIKFLNPHIEDALIHELDQTSEKEINELAYSLFEKDFANDLTRYVSAIKKEQGVDHAFNSSFIYDRNYERNDYANDPKVKQTKAGCALVVKFIKENAGAMKLFNASPRKYHLQKICENYEQNAHDACLVMKADYDSIHSVLLTGDASKKVFYRLIKSEVNIHAYYLKVPHHGSKNNLNKSILEAITPKVAIISHDNGKFGRARDSHPNKCVLELIKKMRIEVALTNNVIKKSVVVLNKVPFNDGYMEVE